MLKPLIEKAQALTESCLGWLPPTLTRVSLGLLFTQTGWGKIHDFAKVTEYFTSLGIPAASFNAHVVGYTELVCGTLILVGLLTRIASVPIMISMGVAILTAKKSDIGEMSDLFGMAEYLYVLLFAWLAIRGPGPLSLDRVLFSKLRQR